VLGDAGKLITLDNAGAITVTIPLNSTAAFPAGTEILITQGNSGVVTLAPEGAVTINSRGGLLNTSGLHSVIRLVKKATDLWLAYGDLA
jgi:hypothetical protein